MLERSEAPTRDLYFSYKLQLIELLFSVIRIENNLSKLTKKKINCYFTWLCVFLNTVLGGHWETGWIPVAFRWPIAIVLIVHLIGFPVILSPTLTVAWLGNTHWDVTVIVPRPYWAGNFYERVLKALCFRQNFKVFSLYEKSDLFQIWKKMQHCK